MTIVLFWASPSPPQECGVLRRAIPVLRFSLVPMGLILQQACESPLPIPLAMRID